MQILVEMLSYPFLVRALVVGALVSLCASLLGVSLVLKRFSMIGDGLSHVGFGSLAIAAAAGVAPLAVAIPVCVAASFLLLRMSESTRIKGDAAIAMLSAGSLAVGVMIVSMTTGMNTDVYNYMFGSILSLSNGDAILSIALSVCVLILFVVFYPRLFAVTFDETFSPRKPASAQSSTNAALATLSSVTVVLGMRMMGALLISSLIIFPVLSAMRVCRTYRSVTIVSRRGIRCLLLYGHDALLSARNAERRKRRMRQHPRAHVARGGRGYSKRRAQALADSRRLGVSQKTKTGGRGNLSACSILFMITLSSWRVFRPWRSCGCPAPCSPSPRSWFSSLRRWGAGRSRPNRRTHPLLCPRAAARQWS